MKQNSTAIITGASSGIGLEFSTVLAQKGFSLLLISNQEKELAATAQLLSAKYHIESTALYMDLTQENAAEQIIDFCKDNKIKVSVLINNAGVFFFNELLQTSTQRIELMLKLHVITLTKLCRLIGEEMQKQGEGYILNMSSLSAWWPVPGITTYNATKAYIRNFSKALQMELKPQNIAVTVVCPGGVATDLYGLSPRWQRIGLAIGILKTPRSIAEIGIKALFKRKKQVIPGFINRLFLPLMSILPNRIIIWIKNKLNRFQK